MGIYRVNKNTNYVVMDKKALHDEKLSWKAKGLHAYMLSMPDDWRFYREELSKHAKDGVDTVKTALKELSDQGYLKRVRKNDENGKLTWETIVYEIPQPEVGKTPVEEPLVDKPLVENPLLLSNKELSNKELSNKELKDKTEQKLALKSYSDDFEHFWSSYPRKVDKKMAYQKWREVTKKYSPTDIMFGLNGYCRDIKRKKTEPEYIKHAKTFLHNECFKEYKGGSEDVKSSGNPEYEGYNFDKEFTPNF
ncbi:hypothetical protein [Shouchella lehensis]|uniref:Helix-turn-helix domain-containing protein n=1 Tax=Shouchella lehensis TaxID=300825 RepID=A0A4Y7WDY7_9BACI|nr:hypothetical protein [Shouchella lehensis]TES45676.1 hypothetical protein E2L03_20040 [Shouchella lehensis]